MAVVDCGDVRSGFAAAAVTGGRVAGAAWAMLTLGVCPTMTGSLDPSKMAGFPVGLER
jgi:hypothetical protein